MIKCQWTENSTTSLWHVHSSALHQMYTSKHATFFSIICYMTYHKNHTNSFPDMPCQSLPVSQTWLVTNTETVEACDMNEDSDWVKTCTAVDAHGTNRLAGMILCRMWQVLAFLQSMHDEWWGYLKVPWTVASKLSYKLPTDLREPHQTQSPALSPITHGSSASSLSPLASSLTRSVFHSELKTWLFSKSFPPQTFSFSTGLIPRTLGPSNDFTLLNGWICLHGVLD